MTDKPTKEFEKIYDEISTKSDFHERFLTEEMYSIEFWLAWLFYLKGRPVTTTVTIINKYKKLAQCDHCQIGIYYGRGAWVYCNHCGSELDWSKVDDR